VRGAAGVALALWLLAEGTAAAVPLCRAEIEVEPERAVVGQQVLYRLRILRRRDVTDFAWERNLSFPGYRAEWLPGISHDDAVIALDESYRVYEERRALFPVRAGSLEIPAAGLRCGTREEQQRVHIPAARVEVAAVPTASRPPGYSGLVGPVEVSLTATPRSVALGETVQISLLVQGAANVWEVPSPLEGAFTLPDAELFAKPWAMARDMGRQLFLRRYFRYELVPRRTGTLRIPAIRIPYFDPARRRFDQVVLSASELQVRPERMPATGAREATAPSAGLAAEEGGAGFGAIGVAAALVAALAGVALAMAGGQRWVRAAPWREIAAHFEAAEQAHARGEDSAASTALASALRLALATRLPGSEALSSEELYERAPDNVTRSLAEALRQLDRQRFQAEAAAPEIDALRARVAALRKGRPGASC
jgi:hypothetical protein